MNESLLPAPFHELLPYVDWALPLERERKAKRIASTMEQIHSFYDAMSPRMEAIILYCNEYPYDRLPADARRLADMSLSLIEVCNLVELYKGPDVMDAMEPARFVPHE